MSPKGCDCLPGGQEAWEAGQRGEPGSGPRPRVELRAGVGHGGQGMPNRAEISGVLGTPLAPQSKTPPGRSPGRARLSMAEGRPLGAPEPVCEVPGRPGWGSTAWGPRTDSVPRGAFPGRAASWPVRVDSSPGLGAHHTLLPHDRHALLHAVCALGDEGEVVFANSLLGSAEGAVGTAGHLQIPTGVRTSWGQGTQTGLANQLHPHQGQCSPQGLEAGCESSAGQSPVSV